MEQSKPYKMATENKALDKARALLKKHGFVLGRGAFTGPASVPLFLLEWWTGPAGCVLLQWRPNFLGVQTFADWPLGSTFASMEEALEQAVTHKDRPPNHFEK